MTFKSMEFWRTIGLVPDLPNASGTLLARDLRSIAEAVSASDNRALKVWNMEQACRHEIAVVALIAFSMRSLSSSDSSCATKVRA